MDLNKLIEEHAINEINQLLEKYKNKLYLSNADVAEMLDTSEENLRTQKYKYKDYILPKKSTNETTRWNKFKFLKWYASQYLQGLEVA